MIRKIRRTTRHMGGTLTAMGATLALVGPTLMQQGIAQAAETEAPCEFFFYPEQPGAKIQEGSPLQGHIEVSPGCQFFQFPNKHEDQLVNEAALSEITGTQSHFRITPNGELLFIIEPPKQPAQPAVAGTGQVSECEQAEPAAEQEIEHHRAELARAHDEIAALETRLSDAQAALQQSQSTERAASERISALQTGLAGLQEKEQADGERIAQLLLQAKNDEKQLDATLHQARAAEERAEQRVGLLRTELYQVKEQAAKDRKGREIALLNAQREIERFGGALALTESSEQVWRDRVGSLEAELAALAEQAAADQQDIEETLAQSRNEIERLGLALEQSQAAEQASQNQVGSLETALAALTEQRSADQQAMDEALAQARARIEQLGITLEQSQVAEQASQDRIGSLEADLSQSKAASASQIERHQQTLSESQSESDRLAAELKQSRHTASEAQQSLEDAKATIAALTVQAAEAAQAAKERLSQATGRIALLEETDAQARSDALAEAAKLNADISELVKEKTALAPWAGRYQECAAESRQCIADLTAKGRQIEQMTQELAATKQELRGLAGDADQDGVSDARDQCPDTPGDLATDVSGCVSIDLIGVEFTTGSDQLRPTSIEILNNAAKLLKKITFPVEIQGHTDSSGNPQDNQRLSEDRARAVLNYLVERGVPADRLIAKGYGDTRPIADNETPEGRSHNRRVEITKQR